MVRAFGMCAGIAFAAACGLSQEYQLPTGGNGVGIGGGNGSGGNGVNGNTGSSGGSGVGVNGASSGYYTAGTTNGLVGTSAGNIGGSGPGGNGPGGNGTVGSGPGGNGPGGVTSSGTSGMGPGGTSGTGTGGKGSTSGGTGGACATELEPCSAKVACCGNMNLTCEKEASAGGSFCEVAAGCKSDSDCTNAQTVCSGGTCVLNICGGNSGNGSYNGTCKAGSQAGTCVPKMPGMDEFGICYLGGTADGGCSETAPTTDPADLCIAGQFCGTNPNGPGEECHVICDPGGRGGTPACKEAGYTFCIPIGVEGECF